MLKDKFSVELSRCLIDTYGRVPSASILARDFNFRSPAFDPITAETARRWLRGLSMPTMERLKILIDWLGLNADFFNPAVQTHLKTDHDLKDMPNDERDLLAAYRRSSPNNKRLLLSLASALSPKS